MAANPGKSGRLSGGGDSYTVGKVSGNQGGGNVAQGPNAVNNVTNYQGGNRFVDTSRHTTVHNSGVSFVAQGDNALNNMSSRNFGHASGLGASQATVMAPEAAMEPENSDVSGEHMPLAKGAAVVEGTDTRGKQKKNFASAAGTGPEKSCLEPYKMDKSPHGICLIINNMNFRHVPEHPDSVKGLERRDGSGKDVEKLKSTFKNFDFVVREEYDVDSTHMIDRMSEYASMSQNIRKKDLFSIDSHANFDSFVCVIMTHGCNGCVYGSDSRPVKTYDLLTPFTAAKCNSLIGKPKMFFIQACQGYELQQGEYFKDALTDAGKQPEWRFAPDMSDFVLSFSTVPEYVSLRTPSGTPFIQSLCDIIERNSDRLHLLEILTLVNGDVGGKPRVSWKGAQMPEQRFTLTKSIYLRRKCEAEQVTSAQHPA